jgi:hypothetical protein
MSFFSLSPPQIPYSNLYSKHNQTITGSLGKP